MLAMIGFPLLFSSDICISGDEQCSVTADVPSSLAGLLPIKPYVTYTCLYIIKCISPVSVTLLHYQLQLE